MSVSDAFLLAGEADLSQEQLELSYSARATVSADMFDADMARYRSFSDKARASCLTAADLVYDQRSGEKLDVYGTGETPRPVVVFIHGGYWRMLSRHDSAFMAPTLARHGIATAAIDYSLAPAANMSEIVRQVRASVAYLWHNAETLGLDRSRIYLCGSSAGGHLVGTVLSPGWQAEHGLPEQPIAGAMPISGLFDLGPIAHVKPQEWLALTEADILAFSPLRNLPEQGCPMIVALAENEAAGFHHQSEAFRNAWNECVGPSDYLVVPDRQHFDLILDFCDERSALTRTLMTLVD